MRTTFISTNTMMTAPRMHLARMQAELAKATEEVATGRLADIGLGLGYETGHSVNLRHASAELQSLIDGNATAAGRLDLSQLALQDVRGNAGELLANLVSRPETTTSAAILQQQARGFRDAFIDTLNGSSDGNFLFAGINSAVRPMMLYANGPKAAVDAAFAARFGLPAIDPQASPLVGAITPADMQDFLDNEFADLFADPAWGNDWSQASDTNITSRISTSERTETSANTNESAVRKLAMAYTMVAELGAANLPDDTFKVVLTQAIGLIGEASVEMASIEAKLGLVQNRIESATERMRQEDDVLTLRIDQLEGVDPLEAKTRIDMLSTQIEMSYATTTRILRLSILNYA